MKKSKKCLVDDCEKNANPGNRDWCRAHYERWLKHGDPLAGYNSRGVRLKFADEALKSNTDDCIEWPYCAPTEKYGTLKYKGKKIGAHVYVCLKYRGPKKLKRSQVGHKCGNTRCINPKHVRWVSTSRNNFEDKISQETIMRGEKHHKAKLRERDIYRIRKGYDNNLNCMDLAYLYDVSPTQIVRIGKRKAWYWLKEK